MKNYFLFLSIFFFSSLFSQEKKSLTFSDYKNEFSLELIGFIDASLQIKYERLIGKNLSIGLGFVYKGDEGLINLSGLDTDFIKTKDLTYSGIKLIPEFRYYLNPSSMVFCRTGFYVGTYFKYSRFSSDLDGVYQFNSMPYDISFDARLNIYSLGFMVGYKLPIGKRFSIDFLIAGPGVGRYDITIKPQNDIPDSFYDDLNQALESYDFFDELNADFNFSSKDLKSELLLPSFRYAISVGIAF